jgi:uncharacterized protein (DUF2336 family)
VSLAGQTQQLLQLAHSREPADRERLLSSIVTLCEQGQASEGALDPSVKALVESIFLSLVVEAERDIRQRLAERLAYAEWAPSALVNVLALDDIDVARPIIAASPVLQESDLIRLLVEATIEHQIEVAQRPAIGPTVVGAIIKQAEPSVMTALAGNDTAEISPEHMAELVEASHQIAAMRSPLARHPRLTTEQAQRLYIWVGQSLRQAIVTRFKVDAAALDRALAEAVSEAQGPGVPPRAGADQADMERRLIAKLHAAGQLRASYLLRALREQRLSLFIAALATLGGYSPDDARKAVDADQPDLLALACISVGVDRGAFATVLELVRGLNEGRPGGEMATARRAFSTYAGDQVGKASAAFLKGVDAV